LMTSFYWSSRGTLNDQFVPVIKGVFYCVFKSGQSGDVPNMPSQNWRGARITVSSQTNMWWGNVMWHVIHDIQIWKSGVMKSHVKLITSHVAAKQGLSLNLVIVPNVHSTIKIYCFSWAWNFFGSG
jgi:hypothetical protein